MITAFLLFAAANAPFVPPEPLEREGPTHQTPIAPPDPSSIGATRSASTNASTDSSQALSMTTSTAKQSALLEKMPKTYAWIGTGFGPRFNSGGTGLGQISFTYRLADWLEPEALAGMGLHGVDDLQVIDRFSFGARFVLPIDEFRPFLWLALHHEHQAEWSAVLSNPIGSTLGISTSGVAHYTGGEVGVGGALPVVIDGNVFQPMLRVNLVYLPALGGMVAMPGMSAMKMTDQFALLVDLTGGVPLRF